MRTTIYIDNDGNVSGLVDDTLDKLASLGEKLVERVSNVEFDHTHQAWVASDMEGNVINSHPVRSQVIEREREYFNRKLEDLFAKAVIL
jgi:hypothetical protein